MELDAILTLAVTVAAIVLLAKTWLAPDAVLLAGVGVLALAGVLTPAEALMGFTNEGLATIALLYVVAQGVTETGFAAGMVQSIMGRPRGVFWAQVRLMSPAALVSGFVNNTPVVAMLIPAVSQWAKRAGINPAQLLMPLSYAAIIGGTCTLIGTSTNLIVNGLLVETNPDLELGLFELAWVGVPSVLVVIVVTILLSRWLLPRGESEIEHFSDARRYTFAMRVSEECELIGRSIEDAGLRHLTGAFLVEINRGDNLLPAVSPNERLEAGDVLLFAGMVESVVDLQKIRGLVPTTDQVLKIDAPRDQRAIVEVVISAKCPVVGKTIREGRFRTRYNAAIIAVARDGATLHQKLGDIVLHTGDLVLLETHAGFTQQQRYNKDFLLVSLVSDAKPVLHEKRYHAALILLAMIVVASLGWLSMFKAVMLAAAAMIMTGCVSISGARRSINLEVIVAIAAAIGLGLAFKKTGLVDIIATGLSSMAVVGPYVCLTAIFVVTAALTAIVSNAAAAVILFPVVVELSRQLGVEPTACVVVMMMAASAAFATPMGYQTNLMVYGPGGYRFNDFVRMGLPVTLAVGIVTVLVAPLVWPL